MATGNQPSDYFSDPKFYATQREQAMATQARLAIIDSELAKAYVRWEQLEALR